MFHTIPLEEWQELRGDGTIGNPGLISNFLLEADPMSPGELARRLAAEAEEKVVESTRSLRADGRAQRFATLTTDLIVNAGVSYISDEESDDEEL